MFTYPALGKPSRPRIDQIPLLLRLTAAVSVNFTTAGKHGRNRILATAALVVATSVLPMTDTMAQSDPILLAAQAAESQLKARVGLSVHDTGNGRSWHYRAEERFPMASTAKTLVCATLLQQGSAALAKPVQITQRDILSYAPVTEGMVGQSVPASQLCAITMRTSDNTAVNAVFDVIGGPSVVTAFLRSINDQSTRLDRIEPDLNEGTPGDVRDTTTPQAMEQTLRALVLGQALSTEARDQLTEWMISNEVGGPLLRAGIPSDWKIGDRTGAGGHGTRGVAAVMWPPQRAPIVAAIYLTETEASIEARNAAIASIGQAIAAAVSQ